MVVVHPSRHILTTTKISNPLGARTRDSSPSACGCATRVRSVKARPASRPGCCVASTYTGRDCTQGDPSSTCARPDRMCNSLSVALLRGQHVHRPRLHPGGPLQHLRAPPPDPQPPSRAPAASPGCGCTWGHPCHCCSARTHQAAISSCVVPLPAVPEGNHVRGAAGKAQAQQHQ